MIRPPPNTKFLCFIRKSPVKLSLKPLFIFPFHHHKLYFSSNHSIKRTQWPTHLFCSLSSIYRNAASSSYSDLNCLSSSYVPPNAHIAFSRPDRDNSPLYRSRDAAHLRARPVPLELAPTRQSAPLPQQQRQQQGRPNPPQSNCASTTALSSPSGSASGCSLAARQVHSNYHRLWHDQQNRTELLRR